MTDPKTIEFLEKSAKCGARKETTISFLLRNEVVSSFPELCPLMYHNKYAELFRKEWQPYKDKVDEKKLGEL